MQVSTHGGIPPKRATHGAAGYDLYTPVGFTIRPGESVVIDLKIKLRIPGGYYGKIESRSGLGFRHGIVAFGGVIDSDYRGTVMIKLFHLGQEPDGGSGRSSGADGFESSCFFFGDPGGSGGTASSGSEWNRRFGVRQALARRESRVRVCTKY